MNQTLSRKLFLALAPALVAGLLAGTPAQAENARQRLSAAREQLTHEKTTQNDLKKKMAAASADLDSSRGKLVRLSHAMQENEKTLSTLEDKMQKAQTKENTLSTSMQADYGKMSNLVLALGRIRRTPPETLILRPGAPLQTAEGAILLESILPAIQSRAKALADDLKTLQALRKALTADKAATLAASAKMKDQKKDLQILLAQREKNYTQTKGAYAAQAQTVAKIAAKAQSLEQLVEDLKQESESSHPEQANLSAHSLPRGHWVLPVQGKITLRFGQRNAIGAISQGIRITARPGALVTVPVGGVVRYAGPFLHYGNMVIIEHGHNLHSLLAGLSRINVRVGQRLSAGEPVGVLPPSGADGPPTLYYELRSNGKPVDPSVKFPDLS